MRKEKKRRKRKTIRVHPVTILLAVLVVAALLLLGRGGSLLGIKSNGNVNSKFRGISELNGLSDGKVENVSEKGKSDDLLCKITVSDNDYFYENERISLNDFIDMIVQADDEMIVEIKDDHASKRAYDELLDKLTEKKIKCIQD